MHPLFAVALLAAATPAPDPTLIVPAAQLEPTLAAILKDLHLGDNRAQTYAALRGHGLTAVNADFAVYDCTDGPCITVDPGFWPAPDAKHPSPPVAVTVAVEVPACRDETTIEIAFDRRGHVMSIRRRAVVRACR
ncbi:MAG: hypothetical protein ABR591_09080 [Candidatus Velthaea sp.]